MIKAEIGCPKEDKSTATKENVEPFVTTHAQESDAYAQYARDSAYKTNDDKSKASNKMDPLWTIVIPSVIGVLTLIVVTIQARIYAKQLDAMKESNRASAKAANAAVEQARTAQEGLRLSLAQSKEASESAEKSFRFTEATSHLDQRAWVVFTGQEGIPTLDSPLRIKINCKNTGKTPAKKFRTYVYFENVTKGELPNFTFDARIIDQSTSEGIVPPNGNYQSNTDVFSDRSEKVVTQSDLNDWASGEKTLFAAGKCSYEDIFGAQHWSTFCFYLREGSIWTTYQDHNDCDNGDLP